MQDLSCLNTIITDGLAVHIDLTSLKSWDLNTGFTSVSLTKWSKAVSDNIFLYDFGLTAFDNGRVDQMHDTLNIGARESKVTLYRVGYNDATGGTFYDGYGITGITASISGETFPGNYFNLDGGYLQGFVKLKNYNYELLPPKFGRGLTIETIVNLSPESFNNGYFFYMGTRAEDKYVPQFSGECVTITATTTAATGNGQNRITKKLVFSGITTSEDHYLTNYIEKDILKKGTDDGNLFEKQAVATDDLGRNSNAMGFFISDDMRIGYTRINQSGLTETNLSERSLAGTGWTIINIVFLPYDIILDRATLDCTPMRKGDFLVYVDGRRFWKIEDFDEYFFKGFKNDREKQLGVPYTIGWGGATFGLKHSYHYDLKKYVLFDQNSDASIGTGFTFTTDPFWSDADCPVPPIDPDTYFTTITGDSSTFVYPDMCDTGTTANTVLRIENRSIIGLSGATTATTLNQYNILYTTNLELLSNRDYIFTANVYDDGIFKAYQEGLIGMFFSGETEIEVIEERPYDTTVNKPLEWTEIYYKIQTKKNTGLTKVKVGLYIISESLLNPDFKLFFDKFVYRGADALVQDHRKDAQLIEQLYDNSFIGGIQKLRIYDRAFNSQEVLHNARIEGKNKAYGLLIEKGGRIIYR